MDSGDILLGNVTTLHLVDELQRSILLDIVILINRTYVHNDIGKLTATTRLLLVNLTIVHNSLSDSLLVVHLRLTLVTLYLELALQTVDNNIEVRPPGSENSGLNPSGRRRPPPTRQTERSAGRTATG